MSIKQQEIEAIRGEIVRIEANQRKAMDRCEYLAAVASWTSLVAESGVALRECKELAELKLGIKHREESRSARLAEAKIELDAEMRRLAADPGACQVCTAVALQLTINAIEAE